MGSGSVRRWGGFRCRSPGLPGRDVVAYVADKADKLRQVRASGNRHQGEIGASLTRDERVQLASLLRRLAAEQGITEHDFPGIPPRPR